MSFGEATAVSIPFHHCSLLPLDDASSAAAVLKQRFMHRTTGGSANPLKLHTERGKAAALGILGAGDGIPPLFSDSLIVTLWRATCFTRLNSGDTDGTIHFTEAAAITRTPGLLIWTLERPDITRIQSRPGVAPRKAPYRLQTDLRTSPRKAHRLRNPDSGLRSLTSPRFLHRSLPHRSLQEQIQRKLATLCPRVSLLSSTDTSPREVN